MSRLKYLDDEEGLQTTSSTISSVSQARKSGRDYHTRFNILLRRFEAVAGPVNPSIKAHVLLRKATLSAEKQSQIVSTAMSRYEYEPLRDAILTAILRAGALRSGSYCAQVVEAQDEDDEEEHPLRQMRFPMSS